MSEAEKKVKERYPDAESEPFVIGWFINSRSAGRLSHNCANTPAAWQSALERMEK